jgi:hypothetical protein
VFTILKEERKLVSNKKEKGLESGWYVRWAKRKRTYHGGVKHIDVYDPEDDEECHGYQFFSSGHASSSSIDPRGDQHTSASGSEYQLWEINEALSEWVEKT